MLYCKNLAAVILFMTSCSVYTSENKANLAKMPIDVMSRILAVNNLGERNVLKELPDNPTEEEHIRFLFARRKLEKCQLADMKDLRSLACVNTSLNKLVNDNQVIDTFITSMADRDSVPKVNIAALMETKSADAWLSENLDISKEYKTFKAMKNIFAVVENSCQQLNQQGLKIKSECCYQPDSSQTKQGLMLEISMLPRLHTPWGRVQLAESNSFELIGAMFACQEVFKAITGSIKELRQVSENYEVTTVLRLNDKVRYCCFYEATQDLILHNVEQLSLKDYKQKISVEEVAAKKGQKCLIMSSSPRRSCIYEINGVGDQHDLPVPVCALAKEQKTVRVVAASWKIMNNKFKEEERIKKEQIKDEQIKLVKKQVMTELRKKINVIQPSIQQVPTQDAGSIKIKDEKYASCCTIS